MKKSLSLLLILALSLSLCPAALGAETEPTAPQWVAQEDYITFPGDPVYRPENWERVLALRLEAEGGGLLPREGRDWAEGSPGQCYETALIRLRCAENYGEDAAGAGEAILAAGRAFHAAESGWYDQNRGRDETYHRLTVEKLRAYLRYHVDYIDDWGRALVPALDALGMTMEEFFDCPLLAGLDPVDRMEVEESVNRYWNDYIGEKLRITVYLDGALLQMDAQPQVRNERTMVPIRPLAEALGADVEWNEETWEVTLTRAGVTLSMTPGQTTARVDGTPVEMDVAPYADQNRTYFPVRYAAQFFGQTVTWNPSERRVDIAETKSGKDADREEWAKAMAALLGFVEGGDPARFGLYPRAPHPVTRRDEKGIPRDQTCRPAEECRELLAESWEIRDREELLAKAEELTGTGHDADFREMAQKVRYLPDSEILRRAEEEDGELWLWTKALAKKWDRKGVRAWDLCRVAALAQWGYTAGYVTYREALELVAPAAQELAGTFGSWDEVYENFLEGYYWCLRRIPEKAVWDTDLGLAFQYLKNAPETRTLFDNDMFAPAAGK